MNPATVISNRQLQDHVDACLDQLSDEWTASFVFAMAPFSPRNNEVDSFDIKTNLQPCDISKFLGGQRPEYTRLYFCPDTYPPHPSCSPPAAGTLPIIQHNQPNGGYVPDSGGTPQNTSHHDPPPSFLALKKDLESEAFTQCRFGLMSNGGASRQAKNQFRRFVCRDAQNRANSKYATSRRTTIQSAKGANLLRTSKLINNRSGDRKDGKSKPRRTTTNFGHHSCTFCFTVRWDSLGLYISLEKSGGCATHRFHIRSKSSSLPTRLLGADERETLGHLAASCCTTGVGQSYLLAKVQMRSVEGDFRRIASLLRIVDTPGRYSAVTAISSIVSQLEDLVYKKQESQKRSSSGRGTQGVVMESHTAKRRMYNTHNDYYR